ncbi:MAG TPA: aminotransferase class I/II-fold pyridoxal phosphate-dependent enzyme [Bryobacteraceae bacterium]|nr:aminotransferase class I/II-fold pyridoxal phosphate-dependent enzyme [Bryobacteraceae bacterium]
MTRLAIQYKAVNLAQGFPDFAAPQVLKDAAHAAIDAEFNQYSITWGAKPFRDAICAKYSNWYGLDLDPEREVTVCCGATEGMIASLLAVTNPGDEIIVFEPYYENYGPDSELCSALRRVVTLRPPEWTFDRDELRRAFNANTKAVIVTSPNNPTGRVFSKQDLEYIASLCQDFDALCITDEIYEHIVYDGAAHIPILAIPGMRDRAILVNSMSKTYSVTGWRVGWVLAAPDLTDSIRKVHDFLTVGAAHPLQMAGVTALQLPQSYYAKLAEEYQTRRDHILALLEETGFRPFRPSGAYYVMADISGFGFETDTAFALHMLERAGVAAVPGSSFFSDSAAGHGLIRFCFCKKYETLEEARRRLKKLA